MDEWISSANRKQFAESVARRLRDDGEELHPAVAHGKKIASSFWGYSWCRHIETWQDYESRLPLGRSLLRAGGVIDLAIAPGEVTARVVSDRLYQVRVRIAPPEPERLDALRARCAGRIGTLLDLVNGVLSEEVLNAFCDPDNGLFPRSDELKLICECLDDSCLCRHLAAVLYGIGARLDDDPSLFFVLRGIDASVFFSGADTTALTGAGDCGEVDFSADELASAFGIHLD